VATWEQLRAARREGSLAAQRLRRRLGLQQQIRVDVFDVIDDQGIWLMFQPLRELYGFYRNVDGNAGIVLNAGHPLGTQRYTAAHELAHHVLGHRFSLDDSAAVAGALGAEDTPDASGDAVALAARAQAPLGDPRQEAAAQAFAATFLMPVQIVNQVLVARQFDRDRPQLTPADIYQLSLTFGSSYEATLTQLAVLDKLPWSAVRGLRLPPIQIKTRLAGRRPADSRADLWLLQGDGQDRAVTVRVHDELMIQLPEIPSTGYRWELAPGAVSTLELVESSLRGPDLDEPVLGGSALRTVHLRATRAGREVVELQLRRPWDPEPVESLIVTATVAPPPTGDAEFGLLERQQRRLAGVS
jgi:predicted secreted protein